MTKTSRLIVSAVLLLAGPVMAPAQTAFEPDFQVWNDTQVVVPLNPQRNLTLATWAFLRGGNELQTITDARIGALVTKSVNARVAVAGGYLYRYSNAAFNRPRYESRYLGSVTFTAPLPGRFTLVNRNLVQYEDRYSRPNAVVLRNRVWLRHSLKVGSRVVEPFVSFETFYDFRLGDFARVRAQVGASHRFDRRFAADLFYVHQNETGGGTRPGSVRGLGTTLRITF